jgi:hypothetical protein
VNGKALRVAMFRGPGAEIVELLEVQRPARTTAGRP